MGPTITLVVSWIVSLIATGLIPIPYFTEHPEILQSLLNGIQWILLAAFSGFVLFLMGRKGWENVARTVQAVVANIESTIGDRPDAAKRQAAIDAVLGMIPLGKFGAQGWLMRIPGVGQ